MPQNPLARWMPIAACAVLLSGCVSFGAEPPASLLDLRADNVAPTGTQVMGKRADALVVLAPQVPAKLDVLRVPVQVNDTEIAYVQDAFWVEKPARLFRRLMAETLRSRTGQLVVEGDTMATPGSAMLRGNLREFGYDVASGSVVVQFDATRETKGGAVETRRFEARRSGVIAEAAPVGAAINDAANDVADEVAVWMLER